MTFGALLAFASTVLLMPGVILLLRGMGVVDYPSARSSHDRPILRGGGIAPATGALIAAVATFTLSETAIGLLLAGFTFGLIGLVEDLRGIPPLSRLALQFPAAAIAYFWLASDVKGPAPWQFVFAIGIVVWIVGFANAFNFMDGINGLSAAQLVVAGSAWVLLGRLEGVELLAVSGAIAAGSALGFGPFNFPFPRVFLGDVGSYFFGAWLAATLVIGFRTGIPPEAVLAPLALYLSDTGLTIVGRIRDGEPWHLPHKRHTYQQLVRMGWSHSRATMTVTVFLVLASALGFASLGSPLLRLLGDLGIVATLIGYFRLPVRGMSRQVARPTASDT